MNGWSETTPFALARTVMTELIRPALLDRIECGNVPPATNGNNAEPILATLLIAAKAVRWTSFGSIFVASDKLRVA